MLSDLQVSDPAKQSLGNLKGEIAFRAKLARQHTAGECVLPDYLGREEHDRILEGRIQTTRLALRDLREQSVDIRTFVELGAERGIRSLVLENEFAGHGIAMDLSFDQLRAMDHFATRFGLPRLPVRVCCDMNHLPLRTGAVPFLFCYQFLHHFPSLASTIPEIRRALASGGIFYFDEEPLGGRWHVRLYQQRRRAATRTPTGLGKLLQFIEGLISEPWSEEVEHGIIENHSMPLDHYCEALAGFDWVRAEARTLRHFRSRVGERAGPRNWLNAGLGGVLKALCRKGDGRPGPPGDSPLAMLGCPVCRFDAGLEAGPDLAPLAPVAGGLRCTRCSEQYLEVDGVLILLPPDLRAELYPEFGGR